MLVTLMQVPAAGVGLPDLHQLAPDRPAVAVQHPAGDDHPLPDRLTTVLDRQVGLDGVHIPMAEAWCPQLDCLRIGVPQVLGRVPQDSAPVRRVVQPGLEFNYARSPVAGLDLLDLGGDHGRLVAALSESVGRA